MSFSYSESVCFCCVHLSLLSLCLSVSSFSFLSSSFCSASGRGLTFTSTRVLVSSTCRQSTDTKECTLRAVRPLACVSSSRDWAEQDNDMANYGTGSCTEEPPRRPGETAGHSAPASLPLPFQIALFLHPVLCGVQAVSQLPSMLMVLRIFQMITVPTFASGSNAKMFRISATTLYVVWTSAACASMFCLHREKKK